MFSGYSCSGIILGSQVLGWKAFKLLKISSQHNLTATHVRTPRVPLPRYLFTPSLRPSSAHHHDPQLESASLQPIKAGKGLKKAHCEWLPKEITHMSQFHTEDW